MRGELMFKILSALEEGKDGMVDLLDNYLFDGIDRGLRRADEPKKELDEWEESEKREKEEQRQMSRRFYALVSYLERDGLVRKTMVSQSVFIKITAKGKDKLENLKTSIEKALPSPKYGNSPVSENKGVTIFTFDIPEKERNKRDWLRCALRSIGFEMIHKSVWTGKDGIPKDFLEDIKNLKLGDYIEIFQITRAGSLRKLM